MAVKPQRFDYLQHVALFPTGDAVQIAHWSGSRIHLAIDSEASVSTPLPVGSKVVEIRATEDCYIAFGDDSVSAAADETSVLFLRGSQAVAVPLDANRRPFSHVSIIRAGSTNGVAQIERLI